MTMSLEDFGLSSDDFEKKGDELTEEAAVRSVAVFETMSTRRKMRFLSDAAAADALDWHFEQGVSYHVITGGQVDNLTMLQHVLRQQRARYVLISTWVMLQDDATTLKSWLERGLVGRFDFYVGEIFKGGYRGTRPVLDEICEACGGRVARFRNHSKVTVIYGELFDCVIEGSANFNFNPRAEQAVVTVDRDLCDFYKSWFDGVRDFDAGYKGWKPFDVTESSRD